MPLLSEAVAMFDRRITDYCWPKHFHDHFVIATTIRGVGRFRTGRGRFTAEPDDIFIFNPSEVHDGGTYASREWNYLSLQITTRAMEDLFRASFDRSAPEIMFPVACAHDRNVSSLLRRLHSSHAASADQTTLEGQIIKLTSILFSRYLDPNHACGAGKPPVARLARIVDYMQANHSENISVKDLSSVSGLHENYLIGAFSKHYGMPPHAYLTQMRVQYAAREIHRGAPIVEAAARAGFYDQSHFHRHFRRIYCVTPGQYVAAMRAAVADRRDRSLERV